LLIANCGAGDKQIKIAETNRVLLASPQTGVYIYAQQNSSTMRTILTLTPFKRISLTCLCIATVLITSCGDEKSGADETKKEKTADNPVKLPEYILVESKVDGEDATYRVQTGDTLPNKEECIAIFRKVADIKEGPATRNTAVFFTRGGFSAMADAHAHVSYTKSDSEPKFVLQTASNADLKRIEALTFDSIPSRKLIVELLEAQGMKIFIYKKSGGGYLGVWMFGSGSYDIEPLQAVSADHANGLVFKRTEDGETFTYKEDDTGRMLEVYTGNNTLYNSYRIIKRGE
jgi:hypothetical protein